jgi:transcriptional regulator with GAF, ATPase, and Fis domain/tetratricopeptide (TPR) repeat protein
VGDLVRRTFGRTDPERTAAIARATGGNPALVYETLRAAAAAGLPFLDDLDDADVARRRRRIWSDRLERLGPDAARLLLAVAAAGVLPDAAGPSPDDDPRTADARLRLLAQRLVRRTPRAELVLDRPDLRAPILAADPERTAAIAAELLVRNGTALPSDTRLRLAVAAGRTDHAAAALEPGVDRLLAAGNPREAADILEWWFAAGAGSPAVPETLGRFLEALDRSGEPRRALALARSLPAEDLPFDLLLLRARLAALAGEDAETDLAAARARTASPAQRAAVAAVAGRARLRRGDSAGARSTAESALPDAPAGPDRIELLLVSGLARDYLDDPDTALARFAEAADEAKRLRADDLLDKVRAHEAFTLQRLGRLDAAADRYRGCLDAARAADDRGALANHAANLGAVLQLSGRLGEAIRHFEDALAAARWVGRAPTALSAQANLANGLAIVGRFESALRHAEEAAAGASRTGLRRIAVQARGTVADVAMRRGALDEAAARFDEVERAYEEEGLTRERWEAALHALDCRLRLGRRADDRLAEAARAIDAGGWDDLRPRLELARARTALLDGDAAAAAAAAARSHETAERRGDLAGVAEAAEVRALAAAGDEDAARRFRRDRKDALERLARDLPEAHRAAFAAAWNRPETDPAGVGRTRAARSEPPTPEVPRPMEPSDTAALFRLLEINRELVRESDPERLLEAIIDSAVRFTGAERGFLLLPDARGDLEIRRVREFSRIDLPDEHRRFSRSIAEQVYRDGEPVITVSAMDDQRFGRFLSVHELRLQSILCVPIRGRERTLGVLYLENRVRRGLFGDADRDLLTAFGDQAALAIENAHLIETLRTRSRDLEEAHRSLERLVAERERLLAERTEQLATARRDLATARRALASPHGFPGLVGESAAMRRTFQLMRRVLDTDVPVTLAGESGTGKEVVARAIHDHGPRKKARFVAVNCGALPESLIESELFGHARGAFTGAVRDKKGVFVEAHGGTLLLDEVGDMPARMQTDLLRALQEARIRPVGAEREIPVDVRIIAASQVPLADLVAAGRFREDLFYRLNVVEIPLPALRERIEDLPLLVDHFLSAFATRFACERKTVTREAFRYLASLPWPGNVRQLEHALLNAWVLAEGDQLGPEEFGAAPLGAAAAVPGNPESTPDNRRAFEADERQRMLDALRAARWNKTRAATTLGMPRRTFYRKLARYGLDR